MSTDLRAQAGDLCMADSMPFQQHFEFRTNWPIRGILSPKLFQGQQNQLYPGDSIKICRYDQFGGSRNRGARLLEIAEVRIVASSREGVELHLCGGIETLAQPAGEARGTGMTAKHKASGRFSVLDKDGNEIASNLDKKSAQDIATGKIPVPKQAA